ncbi:MAG: S41 family peptidase [Planctomycetota bacterium]
MLSWLAVMMTCALAQAGDPQLLFDELHSPEPARREVAAKRLIGLGDAAAEFARRYLQHPDPILALYARRIFVAVKGVSPELDQQVCAAVGSVSEVGALASVERILLLGKDAVAYAIRKLATAASPSEHETLVALQAFGRLHAIFESGNDGDSQFDALMQSAPQARAALHAVLQNHEQVRDHRLVALWALATLPPAERVPELGPFLHEEDPLMRREAAAALVPCVDQDTFTTIAVGIDARDTEAASLLATAAARRLLPEQLFDLLQSREASIAFMAALALGETHLEPAAHVLARRLADVSSLAVKHACVKALTDIPGSVARFALLTTFAEDANPSLRADALAALGARADASQSVLALACGTHDRNDQVRMTARDCLGSLRSPNTVASAAGNAPLAFAQVAGEAARIVVEARDVILNNAIPTGNPDVLTAAALNRVALGAMAAAFDSEAHLRSQGIERSLLKRLVADSLLDTPEAVFHVAGELPFESPPGDLIQLTTDVVHAMVDSLNDRYAHVIVSHDPSGRALPEWAPELFGPEAKTNGLSLRWDDQSAFVEFVLQRSPSDRAGLTAGDQLITVEGQFLKHLSKNDVEQLLGKEVRVSVLRDGWSRPYEFVMTPEEVRPQDIATADLLPARIGYLALRSFDPGCANRVEQALRDLESRGLRGLIIDLRNNPGGSLTECADLADKFLPAGQTIATLKGSGASQQTIVATHSDHERTYPVAILINRCSASASEMFAGCLQELGRATLVGEASFGKGVGQSAHFVAGFPSTTAIGETRSQYLVYFTVIRYELASGKVVQGLGLQPDVAVVARRMSGPLFEERLRLQDDPRVIAYAARLLRDQQEAALHVALEGLGLDALPDLGELQQSVATFLPHAEVASVVRQAVRTQLGKTMALPPDYFEDRGLREAVVVIARSLQMSATDLKDYGLGDDLRQGLKR